MGREGWSQRRGEGFVFGMRVGDGRASRVGARSHSPYDHVIVHLLHHLDELLIRDEELGVEPAMVRARHPPRRTPQCLGGSRCHAEVLREKRKMGRQILLRLDAGGSLLRRGASSPLFDDVETWEVRARLLGVSLGSPRVHTARSLCLDPEKGTNSSQSARTEIHLGSQCEGSDAFVWSFS